MSESIEHAREGIERARAAHEAVRGLRWGATAVGFAAIIFGLIVWSDVV